MHLCGIEHILASFSRSLSSSKCIGPPEVNGMRAPVHMAPLIPSVHPHPSRWITDMVADPVAFSSVLKLVHRIDVSNRC